MAKSPEEMAQSMIQNMKDKTGKALEEWLQVLKGKEGAKHGEIVKHLKGDHGVTHGFANLISHKFRETGSDAPAPGGGDLVAAQYGGGKEGLRPIYDKIIAAVQSFGDDVEVSPKKAYVSLRRSKQFGIIQPSTKTRVDVGINLKGRDATDRLENSGSFNAMVSHRVRLAEAGDVDEELIGWLRDAYEGA